MTSRGTLTCALCFHRVEREKETERERDRERPGRGLEGRIGESKAQTSRRGQPHPEGAGRAPAPLPPRGASQDPLNKPPSLVGGGRAGGGESYFLWCVCKLFPSCSEESPTATARNSRMLTAPPLNAKTLQLKSRERWLWGGGCGRRWGGDGKLQKEEKKHTFCKGRHPTPSIGTEKSARRTPT